MPLQVYIVCLLLTLAIELPVWRYALKRRELTAEIALMNLATNPAANVLYWRLAAPPLALNIYATTAIVEVLVIAAEWAMLSSLGAKRPLTASLVLNASSCLLGTLIFQRMEQYLT